MLSAQENNVKGPLLFANTGDGPVYSNNVFHRSELPSNFRKEIDDFYFLPDFPQNFLGHIQLKISEDFLDRVTLDQIRLYTVDHALNVSVGITENLNLVTYRENYRFEASSLTLNPPGSGQSGSIEASFSNQILKTIKKAMDSESSSISGVGIVFNFTPQNEEQGNTKASELNKSTIENMFQYTPRDQPGEILIDIESDQISSNILLEWDGFSEIENVSIVLFTDENLQQRNLPLLSAEHSEYGNVLNRLTENDARKVEVRNSDELTLIFSQALWPLLGLKRSVLIKVNGLYIPPFGTATNEKVVNSENGEQATISNFPNPFNPTTTLRYNLAKDSEVTLTIYDMLGRKVRTLVNGFQKSGSYKVSFDATNLATGLYIYQLKTGLEVVNGQMLYLR